ncbi:MAG: acyl-CoA dehydrogenase family protein [Hyphomicrobiales bacterium]
MAQITERESQPRAADLSFSSLLKRAKELTPFFSSQATAGEAQGSLTEATVNALRDGGFFSLWIPRQLGGAELLPVEMLEITEALSYADGSTGWVVMATQVAMGTAAAYLDPSASAALFGRRLTLIAGQGAPNGRAVVEGRGFRLTGKWNYGSGLLHSEYIHTGAVIYENGAPRMIPGTRVPETRIFIVPVSAAELKGNWDVLGLKATGSVDYDINGVLVPENYTHFHSARTALTGGNLYKLGIQGLGAVCHTAFALGQGRRMLDELAALAGAEKGRPALITPGGGGESFQEQFGHAEAKLRAARAFAVETQADIAAGLDQGKDVSTRQFTLSRLSLNHATSALAEVCTFAYKYGGGVALRNGTLQRCFRDMYSGTQHITTQPAILRECGRELLGMAPGKVWGPRGLIDPI